MNVVIDGYIEGFRSLKDKSIKFNIHTQELDKETKADLFGLESEYVKILVSDENITDEKSKILIDTEIDKPHGKKLSQSQRLRLKLKQLWEIQDEGMTFETYYTMKMEKIIEHYDSIITQF